MTIISKQKALLAINAILLNIHAPDDVIEVAKREKELTPAPPPGSDKIVMSRDAN